VSDVALDTSAEIHHSHRDVNGGWLRPAVFGAMDGLVSNVALITGVAAAAGRHTHIIVITGLAGLLAGAFSMAVGEWTSVHSQSELVRAEIAKERRELVRNSEAEQHELAALYRSRGLSPALAEQVATELSRHPETLWRIHVREELGVDPDDLPSPRVAAVSSFAAFSVGALLPLLPFLLGLHSLTMTVVVSVIGLFGSGAVVSRLTSTSAWYGGLRQLLLGAAAALVTFGIGWLVGANLA